MTSLTSTNVFTISCWSIEPNHLPPPSLPRFGKFSSTARCKALQSPYCTICRLFVDHSRTIRTIRRLFADYSHYSSTIRGLFVLFVDYSHYSHYSHYSLHYSSFINCRTAAGQTTFQCSAVKIWSEIDDKLKKISKLNAFKKKIKEYLLNS